MCTAFGLTDAATFFNAHGFIVRWLFLDETCAYALELNLLASSHG